MDLTEKQIKQEALYTHLTILHCIADGLEMEHTPEDLKIYAQEMRSSIDFLKKILAEDNC